MPGRRRAGIDRRELYLPRVSDWNWATLSVGEIARRLAAVQFSVERLEELTQAVEEERERLRAELWGRLPGARLQEVQVANERFRDLNAQLHEIAHYRAQALAAIERIERSVQVAQPEPILGIECGHERSR